MFYYEDPIIDKIVSNELESLDKEVNATREAALLETKLSSLVWICTSTHAASIVTVIDANNPAEILNSFGVCANHLLCIASVPGASSNEYLGSFNVTKSSSSNENVQSSSNNENNIVDNNSDNGANNEETSVKEEKKEEVDPESLVSFIFMYIVNDHSCAFLLLVEYSGCSALRADQN